MPRHDSNAILLTYAHVQVLLVAAMMSLHSLVK
jgi:hypothetical protein